MRIEKHNQAITHATNMSRPSTTGLRILFALGLLCCICACAGLGRPAVEKQLSKRIPRNEIESIEKIILDNGYQRVDTDTLRKCVKYVSFTDCTFLTRYEKPVRNSNIFILFSFKETQQQSELFRNLLIDITGRDNTAEVNTEVERIEGLLLRKLTEIEGSNHVERKEK